MQIGIIDVCICKGDPKVNFGFSVRFQPLFTAPKLHLFVQNDGRYVNYNSVLFYHNVWYSQHT